jgi:hypothetical protein
VFAGRYRRGRSGCERPISAIRTLTLRRFQSKRGEVVSTLHPHHLKNCGVTLLSLIAVVAVAASSAFAEFKVGLVLDRGGKDDKSFNASAYEGATEREKEAQHHL